MTTKKTIAVITTGRQDWGILRSTVKRLHSSDEFSVAVIAGGMACNDGFGNIAEQIECENIPVHSKLDWSVDIEGIISECKQISEAVIMAEKCFRELKPDAIMLLGDRFETLAIAQVATLLKIPLIHLHGGEETKGAIDNQIRHAISKLSHLHFVSHSDHAARLIRMGENPAQVYIVGAPGLDNMNREDLPPFEDILKKLNIERETDEPLFLVTYHPPTLLGDAEKEITALLNVLRKFSAISIITFPNNDPGNTCIREAMANFTAESPNKRIAVPALGEKNYWVVLKNCEVVIGNSSSGIIEAPAVPVPVVNIGMRQGGRGFAPCITDVPSASEEGILRAIEKSLDPEFRNSLSSDDSRFGAGNSSEKIYEILKTVNFESLIIKSFYE